MPIDQARQILGEAFIIGGTANTFEDVVQHYRAGADYLGIGPFRFTTTKKNLSPVLGLEGYSSILSQMKYGRNIFKSDSSDSYNGDFDIRFLHL